jgi:hypothetical protein
MLQMLQQSCFQCNKGGFMTPLIWFAIVAWLNVFWWEWLYIEDKIPGNGGFALFIIWIIALSLSIRAGISLIK